jgi:Zn-dependent protease with chaperone function
MSSPKIPYPPSPTDVPEDLTDFPESYIKQQNQLLAGLFVFLIFYIALVLFFAMVDVWCFLTMAKWPIAKIVGMVLSTTFFLYLVKGFFKRHPMDKEMHIEITEEDQPILFGFIHQICDELDAPLPNKVFVSPDVNAAVMPRASLVNLFVEPKKDLLIGLGLVNCMNLSEFKSVLAHEFGHFSQSAMATSYTYVVHRIIVDLVAGEDWFDRVLNWCKRQENVLKIFGLVVGGTLAIGRKILYSLYTMITLKRLAVMRESEFHADLLAVKAAGSDAVALSLLRIRFGNMCLGQAVEDLATARDHKLYSKDIFLHQDRAARVVRLKRKDPQLGIPPVHDHPMAGKKIQLFDPEVEEMEDDVPEMRRTHPPAHELEENAKSTFIPAVVDHRSPWILFTDAADLKERMTYKFYRTVFRVAKGTELTDAQKVQEYIDNEHADTTYDPKYHGVYDDRRLDPGDLSELNTIIHDSPWTEERMRKVYDKLYEGCKQYAEEFADLHKELESRQSNVVGKPSPKMRKLIEEVEKKLETNWEWFKSFDRRVYLLHVQMARQVSEDLRDELVERYRFQMEVQRLYQEARQNFNKADAYLSAFSSMGDQISDDFVAEVIAVLRAAWKALKKIMQDAREINLPAMKNFVEGERLADFILEGKMVPEPPLSGLKGVWVGKLMTQLQGVKNKCFRLHFKSVGGILALQERIAAQWLAARAPVEAEVVAVEVVEEPVEVVVEEVAEIVPAEVVEVVAEEVAAEVIEEPLPLEAEVIAEELPPTPPPPAARPTPKPARVEPPKSEPLPLDAEVIEIVDVVEEASTSAPPAKPPSASRPAVPATPPPAAATPPAPAVVAEFEVEENPFAFDAASPPPAPANPEPMTTLSARSTSTPPAKPPARAEESPAESFVLDTSTPAEETFSLDADEQAGPPAGANHEPAEVTFSLDADEQPAQPVAAKTAPVSKPVEEVVSFEATVMGEVVEIEPAPEPAKPRKPSSKAEPIAAQAVVSDATVMGEVVEIEPAPEPVKPANPFGGRKPPQPAAKPGGSTVVGVPQSRLPAEPSTRPLSGETNGAPSSMVRAASGKRPAVKITLVKPGMKSPFTK